MKSASGLRRVFEGNEGNWHDLRRSALRKRGIYQQRLFYFNSAAKASKMSTAPFRSSISAAISLHRRPSGASEGLVSPLPLSSRIHQASYQDRSVPLRGSAVLNQAHDGESCPPSECIGRHNQIRSAGDASSA